MAISGPEFTKPDIPPDEDERIRELYGLNLLDTASNVRFDRYTSLVADIFGFPIVLVTLVDVERQWFKSSYGLDMRETHRDLSFCAHAINQKDILVIADAKADVRFAGNPLVTGYPYIRFYAGAQVHSPNGQPLGTLCVIDHEPRKFGKRDCDRLRKFADLIESEIKHNGDLATLRSSVEYSAYYDGITGLANQRLLTDRLTKLLEQAAGDKRPVVVLLFNISGLRLLNQSLGTEAGDELLRLVGQRLRYSTPLGGTVARLQADEFVVAFTSGSEQLDVVESVVEQTRSELERPFTLKGGEYYIHVQIGCSLFPDHGTTPAVLIERAAAAIRFTGDKRSNGIRFFSTPESVDIAQQLKIESCLRGAIEKHQFRMVYQPIVRLDDGHLAGVEALIRWSHPELGEVPPDRFIAIAEQCGFIAAIGRWVQHEVCEQIIRWREHHHVDIVVSINVAAAELLQSEFSQAILDQLAQCGISPELLAIEVTEFSLVSDSSTVDQNLAALSKAGIKINIDDFGTGYSSLAYLHRLPLSRLKVDKSFIRGIPDSRHEVALTRTIISMSQTLELEIVAEGIETMAQLAFLKSAHCQFGQGYLMARPLEPDQIPPLIGRDFFAD